MSGRADTGRIRVNGVSLFYEEHGAGRSILCIHGTGSSAQIWGDAVSELARHGRVITYDRRGHTRSERPDPYLSTTVSEHADDAAALLEALEAVPAVVIGRSFGGEVALDLVQRYPQSVSALVLLEPANLSLSATAFAWAEAVVTEVRAVAETDGALAAVDRFYRHVYGDETWEGLPEPVRRMFADNAPAILAELTGEWFVPEPARLASVAQPVLIVSGESSPPAFRASDDALAAMLPGARRALVGGGHMISPASPVVLDFLQML